MDWLLSFLSFIAHGFVVSILVIATFVACIDALAKRRD
jgi:hypothetical protein